MKIVRVLIKTTNIYFISFLTYMFSYIESKYNAFIISNVTTKPPFRYDVV